MKSLIVPINNVSRLAEAGEALIHRSYGMPGMGLIHGETGYGKTTATTWYAQKCRAVYVRALASWTPSTMMETILRELDLPARNKLAYMVEDIVQALAVQRRPLFIDEADYLVDSKRMSETVRDFHDLSTQPVILIGMDKIAAKLKHRQQLTGRIAQDVRFEALDAADARLIADKLCEVKVADDLLERLHGATNGSVRLLVVGLARIESLARTLGLAEISAKHWAGKAAFFTGEAPAGVH